MWGLERGLPSERNLKYHNKGWSHPGENRWPSLEPWHGTDSPFWSLEERQGKATDCTAVAPVKGTGVLRRVAARRRRSGTLGNPSYSCRRVPCRSPLGDANRAIPPHLCKEPQIETSEVISKWSYTCNHRDRPTGLKGSSLRTLWSWVLWPDHTAWSEWVIN